MIKIIKVTNGKMKKQTITVKPRIERQKKKRPGIHSKCKSSKCKQSKNYLKRNRGQ